MANLENKYQRIINQLEGLFLQTKNPNARMATVCALLHHKMSHYFWTGYYLLYDTELLVTTYQGPVACLKLKNNVGVCWSSINQQKSLLVSDVENFPGHIACNSLSKSELVVPLFDAAKNILGVLDVDSDKLNAFCEVDLLYLERINTMIYS
jgi:GAF domain-containing protein